VRFGITFGQLNPRVWAEAAVTADALGYDSLWLPEHLVFPMAMAGQLVPGEEHPPVPPSTPVFDATTYLAWVAARTERIKLGTFVYLLAIRHPFTAARGFATLDVVSGGRAIVGVGAGWLTTEWEAVGLDPRTRGRRLDEAIDVCRRLWTEEVVEHHGEFWAFDPVMFEPKPPQQPLPVHVGGESERALRRAATVGDGWLGMSHDVDSATRQIEKLHRFAADAGRDPTSIEVTVLGRADDAADVERWEAAGVDRLVVVPWSRSSEAIDGMRDFAARHGLS
jgi:probable F420-dependent oxidoreductase